MKTWKSSQDCSPEDRVQRQTLTQICKVSLQLKTETTTCDSGQILKTECIFHDIVSLGLESAQIFHWEQDAWGSLDRTEANAEERSYSISTQYTKKCHSRRERQLSMAKQLRGVQVTHDHNYCVLMESQYLSLGPRLAICWKPRCAHALVDSKSFDESKWSPQRQKKQKSPERTSVCTEAPSYIVQPGHRLGSLSPGKRKHSKHQRHVCSARNEPYSISCTFKSKNKKPLVENINPKFIVISSFRIAYFKNLGSLSLTIQEQEIQTDENDLW